MPLKQQLLTDLHSAGVVPNKVLGQHFIIDENAVTALIAAGKVSAKDTVLEVGPGTGTVTAELARAARRVVAVEKDPALAEFLTKKFKETLSVEIINEDILTFNPTNYQLLNTKYCLLGAPPYYLTSRLFRTFLEGQDARPSLIALIIQKEVAEKVIAEPPRSNLLAVAVQLYGTPRIERTLPTEAFWPQPGVESALLVVDNITAPTCDEKTYFSVVRAGFSSPRKQLVVNLSTHFNISRDEARSWLASAHIESERRAQTVSVSEWQQLSTKLPSFAKGKGV